MTCHYVLRSPTQIVGTKNCFRGFSIFTEHFRWVSETLKSETPQNRTFLILVYMSVCYLHACSTYGHVNYDCVCVCRLLSKDSLGCCYWGVALPLFWFVWLGLVCLWDRVSHWPRAQQWLAVWQASPGIYRTLPLQSWDYKPVYQAWLFRLMLALEIALRPSWLQGEHFADGALSSAFKPETFEDDVCISKAWEACWELGLTLGHDSMQRTSHLWIQMNYITTNFSLLNP